MNPSSSSTLDLQTVKPAAGAGENTTKVHQQPPPANSTTAEPEKDAEFWSLSGSKPYFSVVFTKSQVEGRYQLNVPVKLHPDLPAATVPAVFSYRGKTWELLYHGDWTLRRFDGHGWRKFVLDNNLAVGDACVFELMDSSCTDANMVKFRVQILRSNFPSELLAKAKGFTMSNPIKIE